MRLFKLPLFLLLTLVSAVSMYVPASYALNQRDHHIARSFFYSGTLTLILALMIMVAISNRTIRQSSLQQLASLFGAFTVLPLILAVPFYEAVETTSFMNAYFEMVSSITTTGATLYDDYSRLGGAVHLWRAQVGWFGGLIVWIAAAAVLAPLNLGGFEVTASAEPGQRDTHLSQMQIADPSKRLMRTTLRLLPLYVGLTAVLWVGLTVMGSAPMVALCHAMSVMATSGISPIGGLDDNGAGRLGEMLILCFLLFALCRLTFSNDTLTTSKGRFYRDPEFRLGLLFVLGVPVLLMFRHFGTDETLNSFYSFGDILRIFWGAVFTVLSFLSTTGFESADWAATRAWSGLGSPGMVLMGLSLMGGGVATTAGGVKLLRVYALYLNGLREIEQLVHPSSMGGLAARNQRLRRKGAFIAWVFFMLFGLSLALVAILLAAMGIGFENALILAVSALSTTGPLITFAATTPIVLSELATEAKSVLCVAMVFGRLETLAIIALVFEAMDQD